MVALPDALRPTIPDALAGLSVALVLIPQSLAYAELAGLPPYVGLFGAALPPLVAAFFASSPYLQTGPTAVSALLTFGALSSISEPGTAEYLGRAALLALLVGAVRIILGLARFGIVAYLMSQPVVMGFTSAAAILIVASQIPTMVGSSRGDRGVLEAAFDELIDPGSWSITPLILATLTVVIVLGARRVHPLVPGVLIAVAASLIWSEVTDFDGATIGELPGEFISLSLDMPWSDVGSLIMPALIIAVVGFAEAASLARTFATTDRLPWSANRELVSQGAANVAAAVSGAFPVGASFSRSALSRLAGAQSVATGTVCGVVVLVALPFAPALSALPKAVLSGIIVASVVKLIDLGPLVRMWSVTRVQAAVGTGTFIATLAFSPRVERGVLVGVGLAVLAHLYRETRVDHRYEISGDTVIFRPAGVVWFVRVPQLEESFGDALASHAEVQRVIIDLSNVGRLDYTAASSLAHLVNDASKAGVSIEFEAIPPHASRVISAVLGGRFGLPNLDDLPEQERHQWTPRPQADNRS